MFNTAAYLLTCGIDDLPFEIFFEVLKAWNTYPVVSIFSCIPLGQVVISILRKFGATKLTVVMLPISFERCVFSFEKLDPT